MRIKLDRKRERKRKMKTHREKERQREGETETQRMKNNQLKQIFASFMAHIMTPKNRFNCVDIQNETSLNVNG